MSDLKRPYEVINSEQYKIGRITVIKDTISIDGSPHPFTYIAYKDSVCILPIYEGRVIAIEQYRHTLNSWELELPCGGIEDGELAENAARRELEEETGYHAGEMVCLGRYYTNPGYSDCMCSVFFTQCTMPGTAHREETELIRVREIPVSTFDEMVNNNQFQLLIGFAAWERAKRHGLIRQEEIL